MRSALLYDGFFADESLVVDGKTTMSLGEQAAQDQITLNHFVEDARNRGIQSGAEHAESKVIAQNNASLLERLFRIIDRFVEYLVKRIATMLMQQQ